MPKGTMLVSRMSQMTNTTLRMGDAHLRALHCKYWLWGHKHRAMPEQVMQSPVVLGVDTTPLNHSGTSIAMRRGRILCVPTSEPSLLTTHVVRGQCIFCNALSTSPPTGSHTGLLHIYGIGKRPRFAVL